MIKKSFTFMVFTICAFSSDVYARQCKKPQLMAVFEHSHEITQTPSTNFTVIIEGELDMPTPGYAYSLKMTDISEGDVSEGVLKLYPARPNEAALTVIAPLMISETVTIPKSSKGIHLTVEKGFGWGPTSYFLGLPEDFFGSTFLCLEPDNTSGYD